MLKTGRCTTGMSPGSLSDCLVESCRTRFIDILWIRNELLLCCGTEMYGLLLQQLILSWLANTDKWFWQNWVIGTQRHWLHSLKFTVCLKYFIIRNQNAPCLQEPREIHYTHSLRKEANEKEKVYTKGFHCFVMLCFFKNKLFWANIAKH